MSPGIAAVDGSTVLGRLRVAARDTVLGLIVPSSCAVCGSRRRGTGGGGVCGSCWSELPTIDPGGSCPRCALPGWGGECADCRREPPPIRRAVAYGTYAGGMIPLLRAFKFRGFDLLAAPAGRRLGELARAEALDADLDALVPIPSTRRRNRERGYDPGLVLARSTARVLRRPLRTLLSRTRDTVAQSRLPASRRAANVRGAFVSSRGARGLSLLLVDDVVTTGATAFAAARALLAAGARRVDLLAFARTPEPDDFRHPEAP